MTDCETVSVTALSLWLQQRDVMTDCKCDCFVLVATTEGCHD